MGLEITPSATPKIILLLACSEILVGLHETMVRIGPSRQAPGVIEQGDGHFEMLSTPYLPSVRPSSHLYSSFLLQEWIHRVLCR